MTKRSCDCGCGREFTVTGDGTRPTWQHPAEGGKCFATEACRQRYLSDVAHRCPYCQTWVLDGAGMTCDRHKGRTVALTRSGLAGVEDK